MLFDRKGQKVLVEDLVLVMIDNHILCIIVLRCEEAVHPARDFETVVEHDGHITDLAKVVVSIAIEVFDHLLVQLEQERLVERLDRDDNILHRWYGILLLDNAKCEVGVAKTVSIAPARNRGPVAGMIKAVLRLGCAVKIDHYLQASLSRPINCSVQIRGGALSIRSPWIDVAPVPNWNADQIEASFLDLPEVVKRHEAVPMRLEDIGTVLLADFLAQSPLIDDGPVVRAMTLKNGRCNETMVVSDKKQTSGVNVTHDSRTNQPPRLTPRTLTLSLPQSKSTRRS